MNSFKNGMIIVVLIFLMLTCYLLPATAASEEDIEIEALMVEFDPVQRIYMASGGVKFKNGDFLLQAENLRYNQKEEFLQAENRIKLITSFGTWEGEKIEYSFRNNKGEISAPRGVVGETLVSGEKAEINEEILFLNDTSFTKCDLATPCIKIKASKVQLVEKRVKVKGGLLYLKNLPLLPLPPLTVSTDSFDNWPLLELGLNNNRGLYLVGKLTHEVNKQFKLNYGLGLGTNKWFRLQGGGDWLVTPRLVWNSELTWEPKKSLNGNSGLTYYFPRAEFKAELKKGWTGISSTEGSLKLKFPLFTNAKAEFVYVSNFTEGNQVIEKRQDVGGRITGNWLPGFSLGAGMLYGEGDLKTGSLNGWYGETFWNGSIGLLPTWRLAVEGKNLWQRGANPLWVQNKVELIKDLHCFKASLGYDFLNQNVHFNLGFNW